MPSIKAKKIKFSVIHESILKCLKCMLYANFLEMPLGIN